MNQVIHGLVYKKNKHSLSYLVMHVSVIFVLLLAIEVLNFDVMNPKIVIGDNWDANIVAGCGPDALEDAYAMLSMEQQGSIAASWGAFLGVAL